MKQTTSLLVASSPPTKAFKNQIATSGITTVNPTSAVQPCVVFQFEHYALPKAEAPARHTSIDDLVGKWSQDEMRRAALEQARRWFADSFHGEEGDTVRTLRLRKGWSQAQLAAELGTSQPHVARIERGTENLTIDTCRRLCTALGIDMNTLDAALRRQESLTASKAK